MAEVPTNLPENTGEAVLVLTEAKDEAKKVSVMARLGMNFDILKSKLTGSLKPFALGKYQNFEGGQNTGNSSAVKVDADLLDPTKRNVFKDIIDQPNYKIVGMADETRHVERDRSKDMEKGTYGADINWYDAKCLAARTFLAMYKKDKIIDLYGVFGSDQAMEKKVIEVIEQISKLNQGSLNYTVWETEIKKVAGKDYQELVLGPKGAYNVLLMFQRAMTKVTKVDTGMCKDRKLIELVLGQGVNNPEARAAGLIEMESPGAATA